MTASSDQVLRQILRENQYVDERVLLSQLVEESDIPESLRSEITSRTKNIVTQVRESSDPVLMESFLAQYGLSTSEGVALMCLAEALLRVPDNQTVDALIHDKISPANWGKHLGQSSSSMVNASTWALMLTGTVIADEPDGIVGNLRGIIRRLGEPVIRTAVNQAIRELGNQFVLGENIDQAIQNSEPAVNAGFSYSYDMLGEAALTDADAKRYHLSYSEAIAALGKYCQFDTVAENPGISVKLSALFARYEFRQRELVMVELVSRTRSLAMLAKSANMGFNIDAEEADRLDLSLDVIEAVLESPGLADWDGFGIVVQAYSKRASFVIDWLYDLAVRLDRRIMVRLVKGAYWDTEIKRAQVEGFEGYPVFTRKENTDISYICCAKKLLGMVDRIYPQFATHNAHTVAAVHELAKDFVHGNHAVYEFQRLHGMGDTLHKLFHKQHDTRCRIYAPVGAHEDLLAYLVRRLLENGANSSFVNQLVDESISPQEIASDPFTRLLSAVSSTDGSKDSSTDDSENLSISHPGIPLPCDLYAPERINSNGLDFNDPIAVQHITDARSKFDNMQWFAAPMLPGYRESTKPAPADSTLIKNPATGETVGFYAQATDSQIEEAFQNASKGFDAWRTTPVDQRANCLLQVADLYEQNTAELIELTCREAGKTIDDSIAEIREAVDFLRYYASEAQTLLSDSAIVKWRPLGTFICISPWNFPLAIYSGQIAAALVSGNCVIAKPAEQTPLIAARAVALMHQAGIPESALQLLPGNGSSVGAALTSHPQVSGICFTGSTATAQHINQAMEQSASGNPPLIAETGGINAMIVDSTALPEQAVQDIIDSSFRSAGQRCSALRLLCVQSDVAEKLVTMLKGAMDMLVVDDPAYLHTDCGPVIDDEAHKHIFEYCQSLKKQGKLLHQSPLSDKAPSDGNFILPSLFRVNSINDVEHEIFGPVLHLFEFDGDEISDVVEAINSLGYGLTFGLHTRVDERVQDISDSVSVGNLYINRNQIGAVVGSQPFGGHGLSGTGPKAGGPHYLLRFMQWVAPHAAVQTIASTTSESTKKAVDTEAIQQFIDQAHQKVSLRPAGQAALIEASLDNAKEHVTDHQSLFAALLENAEFINALPQFSTSENSENLLQLGNMLDTHFHPTIDLPGPTGESNRLSMLPAGTALVIGRGHTAELIMQVLALLAAGNAVVVIDKSVNTEIGKILHKALRAALMTDIENDNSDASEASEEHAYEILLTTVDTELHADDLDRLTGYDVLCFSGEQGEVSSFRKMLAKKDGEIIPLIISAGDICPMIRETTLCIDTTAAGGNASLLAETI